MKKFILKNLINTLMSHVQLTGMKQDWLGTLTSMQMQSSDDVRVHLVYKDYFYLLKAKNGFEHPTTKFHIIY